MTAVVAVQARKCSPVVYGAGAPELRFRPSPMWGAWSAGRRTVVLLRWRSSARRTRTIPTH